MQHIQRPPAMAYRRRADGKYSRWVQVWRWIWFIARCGRRRKRKAKPVADRREERRALRQQLREEAEEWLSQCIDRIVELGDDLVGSDIDDYEDDDFEGEEGSGEDSQDDADSRQVVYGLVNTGNSCFFNSVLQALASAEYLQNYLAAILERMDEVNDRCERPLVSMPLTEALWETLTDLNTVVNRDSAFQPYAVMAALGTRGLNDREQQDAQEAFQLISTAMSEEQRVFASLRVPSLFNLDLVHMLAQTDRAKSHVLAVPRGLESVGTKGLARVRAIPETGQPGGLPAEGGQSLTLGRRDVLQNPFTGLMASRLTCAQCGYTEAVRHFAFDNVSLTLPLLASCTLDQALRDYISIEELSGVQCRKCTLHRTLQELITEVRAASAWLANNPVYNTASANGESVESIGAESEMCAKAQRQAARAEAVWRRVVLNDSDNERFSDSDSEDSEFNTNNQESGTSVPNARLGFSLGSGLSRDEYPINPASQRVDRTHNLPPPYMLNVPGIIQRLRSEATDVAKALRTDVQMELPGVKLRRAYSPLSTKQIAFAKLPPCLCLHPVAYLDFAPYTTNGHLKVDPMASIIDESLTTSELSAQGVFASQQQRRSKDVADAISQGISPQTGYRLQAVVVHIGSHSYGHFITYRRKPRPPTRSGINTPRHASNPVALPMSAHVPIDKRAALSSSPPASDMSPAHDGLRKRRIVGGSSSMATASMSSISSVNDFALPAPMQQEWYLISDEDVQAVTLAERIEPTQVVGYAGTPSILPSLTNLRNLAKRSNHTQHNGGGDKMHPPGDHDGDGGLAFVRDAELTASAASSIHQVPQLIDKCIGSRIWVMMKSEKEFNVTEYEQVGDVKEVNHLDQILLNGNNICMLVPGGE
ncbi:cysteine proteinase [Linderina pennispora]|uniref:Ubiquitin carboxyl-terminal hydrolase n=1 Tax=Linderina pennispora TaxID=61395 RepID=A0A1Y1W1S8_9FUNG|nr:cysteine proteinase [Linderina pennispora]ORX67480.1 cysteine proteinase [Linderina pennispora]